MTDRVMTDRVMTDRVMMDRAEGRFIAQPLAPARWMRAGAVILLALVMLAGLSAQSFADEPKPDP